MPKYLKKKPSIKPKEVIKDTSHTCTICFDKCKKSTSLLNDKNNNVCKHHFCHDCITKWKKNTCPNCRKKYTKIKTGSNVKVLEKPSFVKVMLEGTDVPEIVMVTIEKFIFNSSMRRVFLHSYMMLNAHAHRLWIVLDPAIHIMEMKHAEQCDVPLYEHFPGFCFFVNMIRRFHKDIISIID